MLYLLVTVMCSVVLWNVAAKDAVCGAPAQLASSGMTYCLACANTTDDVFFTAGRFYTESTHFTLVADAALAE